MVAPSQAVVAVSPRMLQAPDAVRHPGSKIFFHNYLLVQEAQRRSIEQEESDSRRQLRDDAVRVGLTGASSGSAPRQQDGIVETNKSDMKRVKERRTVARRRPDVRHSHKTFYVQFPPSVLHASLPPEYGALCNAILEYPTSCANVAETDALREEPYDDGDCDDGMAEEDDTMNAMYDRLFGVMEEAAAPPGCPDDTVVPPSDHMRHVCAQILAEQTSKGSGGTKCSKNSRDRRLRDRGAGNERLSVLSLPNIHLTSPRGQRDDRGLQPKEAAMSAVDDEKLFKQYMRRLEARIKVLTTSAAASSTSPKPALAVEPIAGQRTGSNSPRSSTSVIPTPRQ